MKKDRKELPNKVGMRSKHAHDHRNNHYDFIEKNVESGLTPAKFLKRNSCDKQFSRRHVRRFKNQWDETQTEPQSLDCETTCLNKEQ